MFSAAQTPCETAPQDNIEALITIAGTHLVCMSPFVRYQH